MAKLLLPARAGQFYRFFVTFFKCVLLVIPSLLFLPFLCLLYAFEPSVLYRIFSCILLVHQMAIYIIMSH